MDQIAKYKVQAGIPLIDKIVQEVPLVHLNGVSYLSFYCRYCSAKIASKIMQEDGRVVITSIKYNNMFTPPLSSSLKYKRISTGSARWRKQITFIKNGTSRELS
jgi:hypothetical protein